jgi:hypothetical protein
MSNATSVVYAGALGIAAGFVSLGLGSLASFGFGGQWGLIPATLPLCMAAAIPLAWLARRSCKRVPLGLLSSLAGLTGFAMGFAYTVVVARSQHGWLGTFATLMATCWSGAGASAGLTAVLAVRRGPRAAMIATAIAGLLMLASVAVVTFRARSAARDGCPIVVADSAAFDGNLLVLQNPRFVAYDEEYNLVAPTMDELHGKVLLRVGQRLQAFMVETFCEMATSTSARSTFPLPQETLLNPKLDPTGGIGMLWQDYSIVEFPEHGNPRQLETRTITDIVLRQR